MSGVTLVGWFGFMSFLNDCSPATEAVAVAVVEPLPARLKGGALSGLISWTGSFGAGSVGRDSTSRNLTNSSEKDCRVRQRGQ